MFEKFAYVLDITSKIVVIVLGLLIIGACLWHFVIKKILKN